jgi:hypothetical protein
MMTDSEYYYRKVQLLKVKNKKLKNKIRELMEAAEEPQEIDPNVRCLRQRNDELTGIIIRQRDELNDVRVLLSGICSDLQKDNALLKTYSYGIEHDNRKLREEVKRLYGVLDDNGITHTRKVSV